MLGKWIHAASYTERFQNVEAGRDSCDQLWQSSSGELHIRGLLRVIATLITEIRIHGLAATLVVNWDTNGWPSKTSISIPEHTRGVSKSPALSCHYKERNLVPASLFHYLVWRKTLHKVMGNARPSHAPESGFCLEYFPSFRFKIFLRTFLFFACERQSFIIQLTNLRFFLWKIGLIAKPAHSCIGLKRVWTYLQVLCKSMNVILAQQCIPIISPQNVCCSDKENPPARFSLIVVVWILITGAQAVDLQSHITILVNSTPSYFK